MLNTTMGITITKTRTSTTVIGNNRLYQIVTDIATINV